MSAGRGAVTDVKGTAIGSGCLGGANAAQDVNRKVQDRNLPHHGRRHFIGYAFVNCHANFGRCRVRVTPQLWQKRMADQMTYFMGEQQDLAHVAIVANLWRHIHRVGARVGEGVKALGNPVRDHHLDVKLTARKSAGRIAEMVCNYLQSRFAVGKIAAMAEQGYAQYQCCSEEGAEPHGVVMAAGRYRSGQVLFDRGRDHRTGIAF